MKLPAYGVLRLSCQSVPIGASIWLPEIQVTCVYILSVIQVYIKQHTRCQGGTYFNSNATYYTMVLTNLSDSCNKNFTTVRVACSTSRGATASVVPAFLHVYDAYIGHMATVKMKNIGLKMIRSTGRRVIFR